MHKHSLETCLAFYKKSPPDNILLLSGGLFSLLFCF